MVEGHPFWQGEQVAHPSAKPTVGSVQSRAYLSSAWSRRSQSSADFQSAVPPIWNRLCVPPSVARCNAVVHPAECNSAIQQITNLRYMKSSWRALHLAMLALM